MSKWKNEAVIAKKRPHEKSFFIHKINLYGKEKKRQVDSEESKKRQMHTAR